MSHLSYSRRLKVLITGTGLYRISKMLLKSGQLYYAVTISFQLLCAILAFNGVRYTQVLYLALMPLSASMACKVFRMVLLCDTIENPLNTAEIQEALHTDEDDSPGVIAIRV
ncbi:hypothetical protein HWV62_36733 [Athelia sp. TMB]|nr:hypothetical protein HWV62_36733 [Athelia sp. TMB]